MDANCCFYSHRLPCLTLNRPTFYETTTAFRREPPFTSWMYASRICLDMCGGSWVTWVYIHTPFVRIHSALNDSPLLLYLERPRTPPGSTRPLAPIPCTMARSQRPLSPIGARTTSRRSSRCGWEESRVWYRRIPHRGGS